MDRDKIFDYIYARIKCKQVEDEYMAASKKYNEATKECTHMWDQLVTSNVLEDGIYHFKEHARFCLVVQQGCHPRLMEIIQ